MSRGEEVLIFFSRTLLCVGCAGSMRSAFRKIKSPHLMEFEFETNMHHMLKTSLTHKMISVRAITFFLPLLTLTQCCPSPDNTNFIWQSHSDSENSNFWLGYGLEKVNGIANAEIVCAELGGELVSIWNEQIDQSVNELLEKVQTGTEDIVVYLGARLNMTEMIWKFLLFYQGNLE